MVSYRDPVTMPIARQITYLVSRFGVSCKFHFTIGSLADCFLKLIMANGGFRRRCAIGRTRRGSRRHPLAQVQRGVS
jgi:hypothetical protein